MVHILLLDNNLKKSKKDQKKDIQQTKCFTQGITKVNINNRIQLMKIKKKKKIFKFFEFIQFIRVYQFNFMFFLDFYDLY